VIVLAAGIGFKATEEALLPRFDAIFTTSGATGSGRLNEWRAAWASVQERPYLGLGFGAFPAVSNQLMQETPGVDLENFDLRPDGILVHNTYLGSLAELGIPGLVLFLGLLTSIALTLRRAMHQAPTAANDFLRRVGGALQVSLAAWGTSAVFLSVETARSIWILIGLVLALDKLITRAAAHPEPAAPTLPSRTAD
jgi:O-antigen ligase